MSVDAIRTVAVAGGGLLGWSAAAALKRKLPALKVTIVPVPPPPGALTDRIGSTLPSVIEFHRDIGLNDSDAVLRAGCGFRLGTRFEGWANENDDYVHAYDCYGQPFGTTSFHNHWVRAHGLGSAAPFDAFSPAAAMARAGRFVLPPDDPASPLAHFEFGLALDVQRYTQMLRAYARHIGVIERPGGISSVQLRGQDGFIAALTLDDGTSLAADLFADCTGPTATLRGALDQAYEDWSRWLPCDRILFADARAVPDPSPLDRAIAHGCGWRWSAQSPASTSHGLVYASAHLTDGKAERLLRTSVGAEPAAPVALRQGRRAQPWLRNCVALGDTATVLEPLEWTNLHLAHSAIDRLVAMMPDRDCAAVELQDFNRQCTAESDRVRDFLILHYRVSRRDEPFWRDLRTVEPPASLAHSLTLFAERGRLPFYEEETFSRDSWLAVLIGQGLIPRRTDPLIESVAPAVSARAMAQMRDGVAALVATLPNQASVLNDLKRQAAR
jgi:tryptophan halogenase